MAWRFEPPPDASTAMRDLIARILLPARRRGKRVEKAVDRFAERMRGLAVLRRARWRSVGRRRRHVEQNRPAAERPGRRDVAPAVADEHRRARVDAEVGDRVAEQLQRRAFGSRTDP